MSDAPPDPQPAEPAELLRSFLAGRDVLCPKCQYNLRDLTGDRCPECGDRLILRVNLVEPKLAAPIAGVVGLAFGAGLNSLLLLYVLLAVAFLKQPSNGWTRFIVVNVVNLFVVGGALTAWLVGWRRIRNARPVVRWSLVVIGWVLSLLDLIVFTFVIRR
jgi:hypothetical protein